MFVNDATYGDLLAHLNSFNPNPLIVELEIWDGLSRGDHAVAIETSQKPMKDPDFPGCYRVKLYDPNAPKPNNDLVDPHGWYNQGDSYLVLNPATGEWQY